MTKQNNREAPHKSSDSSIIVLLDIDQTLVYSQKFTTKEEAKAYVDKLPTTEQSNHKPVEYREWHCEDGTVFHTNFRPGVVEFVKKVASSFEVHLFTAGTQGYAELIAETLDPEGVLIERDGIWSDEYIQWSKDKSTYWKDLSKLPLVGRDDLSRVVLIDDDSDHLLANPSNVVQVRKFENDPEDKELEEVWAYLQQELKDVEDVRPILSKDNKGTVDFLKIWRSVW